MAERPLKKEMKGTVASNKMDKTVVVEVQRLVQHKKYKKYMKKRKKYKAHDEKNQCHEGDKVLIIECRPLSKEKMWRVKEILEKAQVE